MGTETELNAMPSAHIKEAAGMGQTPDVQILDHTPDLNASGTGYNVAVEETINSGPAAELSRADILFLAPIMTRLQKDLSSKASAPMLQGRSSFRPSAPGAKRAEAKQNKQNKSSGPVIAPHHLKALQRLSPKNPAHMRSFLLLLGSIRAYNPSLKGLVRQNKVSRDLSRIRKMHAQYVVGTTPKMKQQKVLSFTGEAANRLERAGGYQEERPEPSRMSRNEVLAAAPTAQDRRAPRQQNMFEILNQDLQAALMLAKARENTAKLQEAPRPAARSRKPKFPELGMAG